MNSRNSSPDPQFLARTPFLPLTGPNFRSRTANKAVHYWTDNSSQFVYIRSCRVARALFRGSAHSFLPNGLGFKPSTRKKLSGVHVLWTYSAILLVLCFLSLAGFYFLAAFFDIFLILAALISLLRVARGQRMGLLTRKSKV
jgi:hypothetical protein